MYHVLWYPSADPDNRHLRSAPEATHLNAPARLDLDSSALTALALLHQALARTVAESGSLNVTQYRVLLKAFEQPDRARIGDLAGALSLRSNVVTQAADHLQALRLIERVGQAEDGRRIALVVTPGGQERIRTVDAALSAHIGEISRPLSPDQAAQFREAIESAGAGIECATTTHVSAVTSAYVTGIAEAYRGVNAVLDQAARTSFSECRVLLNVHEAGDRARITDVALALALPTSTVTRAADRLESMGWARRVSDPLDHRAVYVEPTDEGVRALGMLQEALVSYGRWRLYRQLNERQQAVAQAANRLLAESLSNTRSQQVPG
jgi:DNA-binding MarR family transcriptional regulator